MTVGALVAVGALVDLGAWVDFPVGALVTVMMGALADLIRRTARSAETEARTRRDLAVGALVAIADVADVGAAVDFPGRAVVAEVVCASLYFFCRSAPVPDTVA